MNGFLGTGATFSADVNLLVQIAMGIALFSGMILARRRRFEAHRLCQSSVLLLNLLMIGLVMAPSFRRQVASAPGPADAASSIATVHAALGGVAELLGLYIVLAAGTKLLPERLRFRRYKPWMRTEIALWTVVLALGIGTYIAWYVLPARSSVAHPATPAARLVPDTSRVTVTISNFKFEPPVLTVKAGTTVVWTDEAGRHSVQADDGSFRSEALTSGGQFEHRFEKPGNFNYFCGFHGGVGGKLMSGSVTVTAP